MGLLYLLWLHLAGVEVGGFFCEVIQPNPHYAKQVNTSVMTTFRSVCHQVFFDKFYRKKALFSCSNTNFTRDCGFNQ